LEGNLIGNLEMGMLAHGELALQVAEFWEFLLQGRARAALRQGAKELRNKGYGAFAHRRPLRRAEPRARSRSGGRAHVERIIRPTRRRAGRPPLLTPVLLG